MKAGKLPPSVLQQHVLSRHGTSRPEVVVPAALGEDSSVLDLGGDLCVLSTDPITGSGREIGWLAVHISCNDVASNGADPVGILMTILIPEHWTLPQVAGIMEQADRAAREVGIQIIGGHTEVTPGIANAIISATVIGRAPRDRMVTSSGLESGSLIIATKGVGLEGTAIFALDFAEYLENAGVARELIEGAQHFAADLSVVAEARVASAAGAVAMHDVTEGGVLGALYEMASASGVGLEIDESAMPVRKETEAICAALGANPLRLIGSGSLLIGVTDSKVADQVLTELRKRNIGGVVVAQALPATEGLWIVHDGQRQSLDPPESDELWRIKERLEADNGTS